MFTRVFCDSRSSFTMLHKKQLFESSHGSAYGRGTIPFQIYSCGQPMTHTLGWIPNQLCRFDFLILETRDTFPLAFGSEEVRSACTLWVQFDWKIVCEAGAFFKNSIFSFYEKLKSILVLLIDFIVKHQIHMIFFDVNLYTN